MDYNQPKRPTTGNPLAEHHHAEQAFKQTRLDFTNIVYQLTARMPVAGTGGEVLSIVEQVQADMSQTRTEAPPSQAFKTRPPVWLDGTDWTAGVEKTLSALAKATGKPNAAETLTARLHAANAHPYAPDNTEALDVAIDGLQHALQRAHTLLAAPSFTIAAECPECGHRHAEYADGTRQDALQAHGSQIVCDACDASWAGERLWLLADAIAQQNAGDDGDNAGDDDGRV